MKFLLSSLSAILLAASSVSAQSPSAALSTLTVTPHCATATAADVVTRSAVPAPACAAGNGTKPVVVSMPGYGASATGSPVGSATPSQFTGGAEGNGAAQAGLFAVAGLVAALLG